MQGRRKLVLVHQFALPNVSGVTVMVEALLRLIPAVSPEIRAVGQSYQGFRRPDDLVAALSAAHDDGDCIIGINLHIEVGWDFTLELVRWCQRGARPFYLHVHDYWPHHRERVRVLTEEYGARLLAITPHIAEALAADGLPAGLLPVGVNIPARPRGRAVAPEGVGRRTVGCVGRIVPRKRFPDVVRGFCQAGLGQAAELYLRLPPSLVYSAEEDLALLCEVRSAAGACDGAAGAIRIEMAPHLHTDYSRWSAYVSASEYEGVSMTPIEAVLDGCPPLVSDIRPHRALVDTLFPGRADEFVFPVGDHLALAGLLRDEIRTGWRRAELASRQREIHDQVERSWSLRTTARAMAALASWTEPYGRDGSR